ncbi:hypothetical protein [Alkalihalobacillus pseudalcaliphilus]|uniref:hypothetical protein n=1 Tax=Alkalihalobacillus pseudalcaliphilus TaxID=79884 RepID=UPI00064DE6FA|nr:hypothetical protein [Alkalihalobacillus pseudalcaliphilus]KMK76321.1 hypothetical protein AB990_14040 [Alkalihalobacillus pseudalcaliphilus]
MKNHNGHLNHAHHHTSDTGNLQNEISIKVSYNRNLLIIELKDNHNQAPQLEINHEKELHLIIISSDMKKYLHLHPKNIGTGKFEQEIALEEGSYKIFVDISPRDLIYRVKPIDLNVGHLINNHSHHNLEPDTKLQKTINNKSLELQIDSLSVDQPTTLTYNFLDTLPEPYLGALGHVIIINEEATQFIHVHPVSDDKTIFTTQFINPGLYKVWGEFKFNDQVITYPFVIEVK